MAFPSELSVARLRANWLKFNGDPSPAILSISARYFTGVGNSLITTAPVEFRLQDGRLDIPVPVGDDPDLSRPLQLDIVARINGTNKPQTWTVSVTSEDVEDVTENGQQLKVVNLNKLLQVDGFPIITLGFVRGVTIGGTVYRPDARGNITLPETVTAKALADALQKYAKTSDLERLTTTDQVTKAITTALADYTKTVGLQQLVRDQILQTIASGPGISLDFNPDNGLLTITNTGGGTGPTNPTVPAGSFLSQFDYFL